MDDVVKKPKDDSASSSDNSGSSSGATSGSGDAKPTTNAAPIDATTGAATGNKSGDGSGSTGNGQDSEQGQQLSITDKQPEQKKPELSLVEKMHDLVNQLATYQLKPEIMAEAVNGFVGKVMANIPITAQDIDGMVQKVDPMAFAVAQSKDVLNKLSAYGGTHVDNGKSGQLALQTAGNSVALGATIQMS